jgi:hypothetical protein
LNTPMHTRGTLTVGSDTLTTLVLLVTIATNSRKAGVGCLATNSRKARFSIGPSKCYIKKATKKLVYVSLRNQKSPVLAVNYGRQKPVFRRVSVVSGVRSLGLYLVVSWCVS